MRRLQSTASERVGRPSNELMSRPDHVDSPMDPLLARFPQSASQPYFLYKARSKEIRFGPNKRARVSLNNKHDDEICPWSD